VPKLVDDDIRTRSQRGGGARFSKTERAIEGEHLPVPARYPQGNVDLAGRSQEDKSVLNQQAANTTPSKLRTDPHPTKKSGIGIGGAPHEHHADRKVMSDCHNDSAIGKSCSANGPSVPIGDACTLQGLAEGIRRILERGQSYGAKKVDIVGTESPNNDVAPPVLKIPSHVSWSAQLSLSRERSQYAILPYLHSFCISQ